MNYVHHSVLKSEVLAYLVPSHPDPLMIDCTVGEGGHSFQFLSQYDHLTVIGLDRDATILEKATHRLSSFAPRFTPVNTWFDEFLLSYEGKAPSLILFDLGISIFHYEESQRGFSFQKNEDLDMRLDVNAPHSVADIINTYSEQELAHIFFTYGEERYSRRIASAICSRRSQESITKSDQLASIIWQAVPVAYRYGHLHPATRSFQALRIVVNSEIERIVPAIGRAIDILAPGGRLGVISFHSLEDRPVKHLFRERARGCNCPSEFPVCVCGKKPSIRIITKKPIIPSEEEVQLNPPSRSAKLRVAEKLEALT